ncbi:6758_t:CDS:2, partial [Cetraspora pellucida]
HGTTSPLQMPSTPGCDDSGFDAHQAAQLLKKLVGEEETNFVVPNEQIVERDDPGKDYRRPAQKPDDIPDGAQLKSFQILDDRLKGDFTNESDLSRMLAANNYGGENEDNWPVWLPVEAFLWSERSLHPFQQI